MMALNLSSRGGPTKPQVSPGTPLQLSEEDLLEHACSIWFQPPEGRATHELSTLSGEEREKVWADMSGNTEMANTNARLQALEDPIQLDMTINEL